MGGWKGELADGMAKDGMGTAIGDCWFLTGSTASGKTGVGIELAQILGAEIVSLDSMAVYRGMDIGTAKPNADQRRRVPHHLLDLVDPWESFSVAQYREAAAQATAAIGQRGREVLFVGGTPLYLKALLRGLFEGPPADWEFRHQIEAELASVGSEALHRRLAQVDPLSARKLHPRDVRRMIRALEVYTLTGQPISHLQMQFDEGRPAEACRVFVLDWPVDELAQRIDCRVAGMFSQGLVEETRQIVERGGFGATARQAVGYGEVLRHLQGDWSREQTIEEVKIRTRRFAKRQRTWFRSLSECRFVPITNSLEPAAIAQQIVAHAFPTP